MHQLAVTHSHLGMIYTEVGDVNSALTHFHELIRYAEGAGDLYTAARTRDNVAVAFTRSGRFTDALEYVRAALRTFETYGDGAVQDVEYTKQLIAGIEQQAQEG